MIAFLLMFAALGGLFREMAKRPEARALTILAALVVVIGVTFYTFVEKWSVLDAAYFCIVTLGTVGYGDITPTTPLGKVFTMVYIIVGLGIIGGFFATVSRIINPQAFLEREKQLLRRSHSDPSEAGQDRDSVS